MRIAVPMTGECLDQHFGHCQKFALIDVSAETREVTAHVELAAPEHQHGLLPLWLKERGATLVIAGGMGAHALALLREAQIEVITGAPSEPAAALVRRYLDGGLESVDRKCDHVCSH